MPNTSKGTPYVQSSDLVSAYPTTSLSLANHIDNNLAYNAVTYNAQTGTTYTFVLADASTGRVTTASNAAAQTYTVPPQTSVTWATGAVIRLVNIGAGAVTIAAGAGVTVNNATATVAQWQAVEIIRTGTDTWTVVRGETTPTAPGLAFITSSTFSASTAVNVNNCFTSTYFSYLIMLNETSFSATADLTMRLRVSGTDNSSTNYEYYEMNNGTGSQSTGQTSFRIANSGGYAQARSRGLTINGPANASFNTNIDYAYIVNNSTSMYFRGGLGQMTVTTAYDGFSLIPSTGNITGTVRVYGYRNS